MVPNTQVVADGEPRPVPKSGHRDDCDPGLGDSVLDRRHDIHKSSYGPEGRDLGHREEEEVDTVGFYPSLKRIQGPPVLTGVPLGELRSPS